jgi:hypothetical protein
MNNALPAIPKGGGSSPLAGVGLMRRASKMLRYRRSHIRLSLIYPDFIAQQLVALCQHYQLYVTYVVREHWHPQPLKAKPPFALLSIGQSYVIARDFYVSTLTGSAYVAAGNSWR